MRLAWYAGASAALAAGVVFSAFHQRANFYSAMVYLFQSNLCMMILVNLIVLVYSSFVYSLQRICFGQLRAIEVEQLYEKAWFAVTETCLAMTIFRDEIGGFFIVMFVALLTGKVWGWIGEGRIEALEQQPPANPRLFHTRLSISLILSLVYDTWLLRYAVKTVIEQARPDMMVMFLFEFAVLLVTSFHTAMRYAIILLDTRIIKKQTQERLQERRRQVREDREEILRRREAGEPDNGEPLPDEDDVDEMDIEVPGWEAKGQYVLGLDLWTDFVKLCIYGIFFFVLLSFYGLPLHIIRDLFMTVRSFVKRLGALMKYRQAIKDMNKYADATEEELTRENTCIICREDMHVWNPNDATSIERSRPKKLPCGHILHLGCLKSWMERQQVCPTCRRSVVITHAAPPRNGDAVMFRIGLNLRGEGGNGIPAGPGGDVNGHQNPGVQPANGAAVLPAAGQGAGGNNDGQQPPMGNNGGGIRMFNFGPFRLGFAQGGAQDIQDMAQRLGMPVVMAGGGAGGNAAAPQAAAPQGGPIIGGDPGANLPGTAAGAPVGFTRPNAPAHEGGPSLSASSSTSSESLFADLRAIEERIEQGTIELQLASAEAQTLRLLLSELQRIRERHASEMAATQMAMPPHTPLTSQTPLPRQPEHVEGVSLNDNNDAAQQPPQPQQSLLSPSQVAQAAPPANPAGPDQPQVLFHHTQIFGQPEAPPFGLPRMPQSQTSFSQYGQRTDTPTSAVHFTTDRTSHVIPAGSPELPAGVQIPAGWSLVPLQRFDSSIVDAAMSEVAGQQEELSSSSEPADATGSAVESWVPANNTGRIGGGQTDGPPSGALAATTEGRPSHEAALGQSAIAQQAAPERTGELRRGTIPGGPPNWGGPAQLFGRPEQERGSDGQEQPNPENGLP